MKREVTGWRGATTYGRVLSLDKSFGGHRPCRERNQTYSKCDTELEQHPVERKQTASDYLNCSEMKHGHAIMEKLSPSRSPIRKGVDAPPL